jgi:hypothetical protein
MLQLGFQHNAKGPRHCNDRASCRRCARDAVSGCYHAKKSTPLQDIAGHDVTRGQTTPLCRAMPTLIRDVSADAAAPDARDRWSFTLLAHASSVPIVATPFGNSQGACMTEARGAGKVLVRTRPPSLFPFAQLLAPDWRGCARPVAPLAKPSATAKPGRQAGAAQTCWAYVIAALIVSGRCQKYGRRRLHRETCLARPDLSGGCLGGEPRQA